MLKLGELEQSLNVAIKPPRDYVVVGMVMFASTNKRVVKKDGTIAYVRSVMLTDQSTRTVRFSQWFNGDPSKSLHPLVAGDIVICRNVRLRRGYKSIEGQISTNRCKNIYVAYRHGAFVPTQETSPTGSAPFPSQKAVLAAQNLHAWARGAFPTLQCERNLSSAPDESSDNAKASEACSSTNRSGSQKSDSVPSPNMLHPQGALRTNRAGAFEQLGANRNVINGDESCLLPPLGKCNAFAGILKQVIAPRHSQTVAIASGRGRTPVPVTTRRSKSKLGLLLVFSTNKDNDELIVSCVQKYFEQEHVVNKLKTFIGKYCFVSDVETAFMPGLSSSDPVYNLSTPRRVVFVTRQRSSIEVVSHKSEAVSKFRPTLPIHFFSCFIHRLDVLGKISDAKNADEGTGRIHEKLKNTPSLSVASVVRKEAWGIFYRPCKLTVELCASANSLQGEGIGEVGARDSPYNRDAHSQSSYHRRRVSLYVNNAGMENLLGGMSAETLVAGSSVHAVGNAGGVQMLKCLLNGQRMNHILTVAAQQVDDVSLQLESPSAFDRPLLFLDLFC